MNKQELLRALLGDRSHAKQDEAFAVQAALLSAQKRAQAWGSRFPVGTYDALLGGITNDYIQQKIGPGWLSSPVAKGLIRAKLAAQKGPFDSLGSFDLINAAQAAQYAASLSRLSGNTPVAPYPEKDD